MKKLLLLSAILVGAASASQAAGFSFRLGLPLPVLPLPRVIVRPAPVLVAPPVVVAPRFCAPPVAFRGGYYYRGPRVIYRHGWR